MDNLTLAEYGIKTAILIGRKLKKLYILEVDEGMKEAFKLALSDWSEHAPSLSDRLRLDKALEEYAQNATSYEALDADTRAFIDCFKKRLSEQAAAHNYLMTLRADEQAKNEAQNLREHQKTQESIQNVQESIQGVVSRMEGLNMTPQYIKAIIQELPLKQGLEPTVSALEEMFASGRLHSEGAKQLFLEFAQLYFEYTKEINEEAKRLREAGDNYLAETLEEINKVLTGESEQSLTDVYKEFKDREQENRIRVLEPLIEAAQLRFSFGEACGFYERLIEAAPTAENHFRYARLLHSLNRFDKARQYYEEALKMYRELANKNPEKYLPDVAKTLNNLGVLLANVGELKQAQTCFEEILQISQKLAKKNPEKHLSAVATTLSNLGNLLCHMKELEQAKTHYDEALKVSRTLDKKDPELHKSLIATILNNRGGLFSEKGKSKQALADLKKALKIRRELMELKPKEYKLEVAMSLYNLGILLRDTNKFHEAQTHLKEALQIYRELADKNPMAYNPEVAQILTDLTMLYVKLGMGKEAEEANREANSISQGYSSSNSEA